jgi:methionyl-tRNA synthetase
MIENNGGNFMVKDNVLLHSVIFSACLLGTDDHYTTVNHLSGIGLILIMNYFILLHFIVDYLHYEGSIFATARGIGVFGDRVQNTKISSNIWRFDLIYIRPETQVNSLIYF